MSSGRFLGGILIGGALGAIIGLLLAPRSGHDTRELIREDLEDRLDKSVEGIRNRADEVKLKAENLRERGQSIVTELEETGREAWSKLRTSVKPNKGVTPEESPN